MPEFLVSLSVMLKPVLWLVLVLPFIVIVISCIEQKFRSAFCDRKTIGVYGLLQPLADTIKYLAKENIVPDRNKSVLFLSLPVFFATLSVAGLLVIPFDKGVSIVDYDTATGVLYLMTLSFIGSLLLILRAWTIPPEKLFYNAIAAFAVFVSSELSGWLAVLCTVVSAQSLDMNRIIAAQDEYWFIFTHFPVFVVFVMYSFSRVGIAPYGLLTNKNHDAHSSGGYVLMEFSRYVNILLLSGLVTVFFLGGWLPVVGVSFIPGFVWFVIKVFICVLLFCAGGCNLSRYRLDTVISAGFKVALPLSLLWLVITAFLKFSSFV